MDVTWAGAGTACIAVEETSQVGQARRTAHAIAERLGFDSTDAGRAALVVTELATNVLRHGRGGHLFLGEIAGNGARGIEVCAVDRGPGFDHAACRVDGFSTGGTPGTGLGAIERQAEVFDSWSDARGAIVVARLYAGALRADLPLAARCVPMAGEQVAGDAWHAVRQDACTAVAIIDGLGHGPAAGEAAQAGIAAFARAPCADPAAGIARMHAGMGGTRGGAAAIARHDADTGTLTFCGIGNIGASLIDPAGSRGMPSHAGIVGGQFRRTQNFEFPHCHGKVLVMHSDGLQSRWNLQAYPGLIHRHPATIVALLMRDFDRGRDDATVVVARLGG